MFMNRVPAELLSKKEILAEAEAKAVHLLKEIKPFNFPVFERRFLQKSYDGSFVETIFNEVMDRFRQQDRIGTAESYKVALRKLLKFKPRLRFEDVDATFLYKFEEWMLEKGNSITTVGIYTRCLRAIFNEAEFENDQNKEQHIFYKHSGKEIVVLDPILLKHITTNILSNAIKFSTKKPLVEIKTKWINGRLILVVKDYGIGIPPEYRKHLFEQFYRASNAINIQGTGLGLHLVSKYVDLMNGTMHYTSELEKGTQFVIGFRQDDA